MVAALSIAAVALLGGVILAFQGPNGDVGAAPTDTPADISSGTPVVETSPGPPLATEDSDGSYTTSCDYSVGDPGGTEQGSRAVASAEVKNTGNVGILLWVKARWDMVGRPSLVATKEVRLGVDRSEKVDFSVAVSGNELDAMQRAAQAFDDWCRVEATITDTFGSVQS